MALYAKSLFAENYVVTSSVVSMSIAHASGSTIFGDTVDDSHTFTGNITASGNVSGSSTSTASFGYYQGITSFAGAAGTETLFSGSVASTGSFGKLELPVVHGTLMRVGATQVAAGANLGDAGARYVFNVDHSAPYVGLGILAQSEFPHHMSILNKTFQSDGNFANGITFNQDNDGGFHMYLPSAQVLIDVNGNMELKPSTPAAGEGGISGSQFSSASFGKLLGDGSSLTGLSSFAGAAGTETLISGSSSSTGSFGAIRSGGLPLYVSSTDTGIGTTSPDSKLQVVDDFSSTNRAVIRATNNDAGNYAPILHVYSPNVGDGSHSGTINFGQAWSSTHDAHISFVGDPSDPYISIGHWGVADLVNIRRSGNVGIGVVDPDSLLEVAGTSHFQGAATFDSTISNVSTTQVTASGNISGSSTSTGSFGMVGIGAITNPREGPETKLHVFGPSKAPSVALKDGIFCIDGSISLKLLFGSSNASPYPMWMQVTDPGEDPAGVERHLLIQPVKANVSIGSETNPPEKLTVTGNIYTSGHITGSGNLEIAGNISGSSSSTGSFGTMRLDYDNLPTSDPSVKGAVWRDGTDLKISAG